MELTGAPLPRVKTWLEHRELVGVRRGPHNAVMVPASFLTPDGPVPTLRGTVTVLSDGGMGDAEIIDWLHQPDDTLEGGSAIGALRAGRRAEVRKRAQEEAC